MGPARDPRARRISAIIGALALCTALSIDPVLGFDAGESGRATSADAGTGAAADALPGPAPTSPPLESGPDDPRDASFCVVVRTYWGHGTRRNDGLELLLRGLQNQNLTKWEAILLVMDGRPFHNLHHIVSTFDDPRMWVFAEWVGKGYEAKTDGAWAPGYHEALYNLTDDAVAACPEDTTWVIVTNGDNELAQGFLWSIADRGRSADLVALDFFSRFQRPTAPACDRFSRYVGEHIWEPFGEGEGDDAGPGEAPSGVGEGDGPEGSGRPAGLEADGPAAYPLRTYGEVTVEDRRPPRAAAATALAPACKRNRVRWCQTDLGANALRRSRMVTERVRYGGPHGGLPDAGGEHADGLLAGDLVEAGWRVAHVDDVCLFSHSPNPHSCAWSGRVWDDRAASEPGGDLGGDCVTEEEAMDILSRDPDAERVEVPLSRGPHELLFADLPEQPSDTIGCLRKRHHLSEVVWGPRRDLFGSACADDLDLHAHLEREERQGEAWRWENDRSDNGAREEGTSPAGEARPRAAVDPAARPDARELVPAGPEAPLARKEGGADEL